MKRRHRKTVRATPRRPFRGLNRASLRGRRRGPDDFAQMLAAFGRAVRAHRKLARLAPSFFDAAVINRERENRAEQRRWMALWEPIIAKAYGVEPDPFPATVEFPPLPHPNTQRAVDRQLVELQLWLTAAHAAGERHRQRRPHALPTLTQLARLLQRAFDLKKMVLGLDSNNPLPDKITYDYEYKDLKRAYGAEAGPALAALNGAGVSAAAAHPVAGGASVLASRFPIPDSLASVVLPLPITPAAGVAVTSLPVASLQPDPPVHPRCDAWSRWARQVRRRRA